MKYITFLFILFSFCTSAQVHNSSISNENTLDTWINTKPKQYEKNQHVKIESKLENGKYNFSYSFHDQKDNPVVWEWSFNQKTVEEFIPSYGIEKWAENDLDLENDDFLKKLIEHYVERKFTASQGFDLVIDIPAIVNQQRNLLQPIFELANKKLGYNPTLRQRVNLLLAFCSDIPYGIPPDNINDKFINGCFSPILTLMNRYGDCDSKSTLLASLLSLYEDLELVLIDLPDHTVIGVKEKPLKGEDFVIFNGDTYLIADASGPAMSALGNWDYNTNDIVYIIPLKIEEHYTSLLDIEYLKMVKHDSYGIEKVQYYLENLKE